MVRGVQHSLSLAPQTAVLVPFLRLARHHDGRGVVDTLLFEVDLVPQTTRTIACGFSKPNSVVRYQELPECPYLVCEITCFFPPITAASAGLYRYVI